ASSVVVVFEVVSFSVAVAQSYVTVSGQTTFTENESVPPPAGTVKLCESELSVDGELLPSCAAEPVWPLDETLVVPDAVQPARPDSKPPLVTPAVSAWGPGSSAGRPPLQAGTMSCRAAGRGRLRL